MMLFPALLDIFPLPHLPSSLLGSVSANEYIGITFISLSHLIVKNEDRIQNFAYRNSHNGFEPISYSRLAQQQEFLSFILFVCKKSS